MQARRRLTQHVRPLKVSERSRRIALRIAPLSFTQLSLELRLDRRTIFVHCGACPEVLPALVWIVRGVGG